MSGRCGASRKARSSAYSPLVSATRVAVGVDEPPGAALEPPAGEAVAAALGVAGVLGAADLLAAQDGADAGVELAQAEGLGDVVVGAELEADDAVDLLLAVAGDDDDGNVGDRPDLAQEVEAVLAAEAEVEQDDARLGAAEVPAQLGAARIAVAGTFCDSKNSVIIRCTAGSSSITRT